MRIFLMKPNYDICDMKPFKKNDLKRFLSTKMISTANGLPTRKPPRKWPTAPALPVQEALRP